MDRRVVLAGFAAAIAVPALAQQNRQTQSAQTSGSGSSGASGQSNMRMTDADMRHMRDTMMMGMVALETSRIALEKARGENVKQFAQFEVNEQQTISEVLRSMMEPAATAATSGAGQTSGQAGQTGSTSTQAMSGMQQMDAEMREMVEKLRGMQAGAQFDREYIQGQIQGHQQLLQVQERYLQGNPQNREHMNVAKMARGHIREHITMLQDIQKNLG